MVSFFKAKGPADDFEAKIDKDNIPKHIAIIMDGNGRWAKKKNLPRTMGHKAGIETMKKIVKEADKLGIKYLTVYAFSTENWKRPKEEVSALMKLLVQYLRSEIAELHENNVVLKVLGDITQLPDECETEIRESLKLTENNTGLILNIAFNYGGRDEIVRAIKLMCSDVKNNIIKEEDINSELVANYLYTKGIPDPDLIIRPSGEQRLSNFLLWQCAYSEFWYSDINWPDFKEEDLRQAIFDYQNRDRRFGKVK